MVNSKWLWSAVLFVLFIAVSGFTEGKKSFETGEWSIEFSEDFEDGNQMQVFVISEENGRKRVLKFTPDPISATLLDASEVRIAGSDQPLLMTHWKQGVHSEALRIFSKDASTGSLKLLHEVVSVHSVDHRFEDGRLVVNFWKRNAGNDGITLEEWKL